MDYFSVCHHSSIGVAEMGSAGFDMHLAAGVGSAGLSSDKIMGLRSWIDTYFERNETDKNATR